jgi:hypothetical protein
MALGALLNKNLLAGMVGLDLFERPQLESQAGLNLAGDLFSDCVLAVRLPDLVKVVRLIELLGVLLLVDDLTLDAVAGGKR